MGTALITGLNSLDTTGVACAVAGTSTLAIGSTDGAGAASAAAGAVGAAVATFFTFLPSFLFILLGGPFIESTHGQLRFTAPLTGITAAVVGVVLNLAVFFAYHVLWPAGLDGPFDVVAAAISIAAFVALWRYGLGVIKLILICGLIGVLLHGAL